MAMGITYIIIAGEFDPYLAMLVAMALGTSIRFMNGVLRRSWACLRLS